MRQAAFLYARYLCSRARDDKVSCIQAAFWSDPDCEKGHTSALNPPAGSSPVHTRIRRYSSSIVVYKIPYHRAPRLAYRLHRPLGRVRCASKGILHTTPIAAPRNQRRRAAQRGPIWDVLCFSLPGQGDWQFPVLTTRRTLSFLVITKVHGLLTLLWPRDRWCDRLTLYIRYLSTKNFENRLPFELQCWSTTHFETFVELSALLLYLERFGGKNMV